MSSIKTTQIDGDISIGRNVALGGRAEISGSVSVGLNLTVDGWLEAKNIKGVNKGLFKTETQLRESYPNPHYGWWALVAIEGSAASDHLGQLYIADGENWVAQVDAEGNPLLKGNPTLDSTVYMEAVEGLTDDLKAAEARVAANEDDIRSLRTTQTAHTNTLNTLNEQMQNAQSRLDETESGLASASDSINALTASIGAANGIATLDSSRHIPEKHIPNKFGHCRVTADNILQFFSSVESQELYDTDPESHADLLLGQTPIVTSGGGGGSAEQIYNLKVQNNLSTRQLYASVGAQCFIDFTFISQVKDDNVYVNTGERGRVEISVRSETDNTYVVKKQYWVNSAVATRLDVSPYLETGANSVMVKITGEQTEMTAIALVYTVQLTSLSLSDSGFAWWIAQKNDIIIPLRIGGNISKILNVKVSDNYGSYAEEYHINLYNNIYLETAYNYKLLHPNTTGVFKVEMYVSNADGQLKTNVLTYNIMCVVPGQEEPLFVVNNLIETPANWVQNKFCEYAVYNGGQETSSFTATITKEENIIYRSEQIVNCEQKYALTTELEVETIDDSSFEIDLQLSATEVPIQYSYKLMCDNSLGFSAVAGAELYINPKKRTNEQLNKEVIINEIDSSQISAVWNGFNWGSDGWVEAAYGRALRVRRGASVAIDWMPFATECANIGKTIEVDFIANNVLDPDAPIIAINQNINGVRGLTITPNDVTMMTSALKDSVNQSTGLYNDKLTHISLVVMPDAYGNDGFNLCFLYVNGVKNREFTYDSADLFAHSGQLTIGSTGADVDVYGVRGYNTALTASGIVQNRINWLLDNESKNIVRTRNNIQSTDGQSIDFEKCKSLFNVFTFDKEFPSYNNKNKMLGTLEVFFHDRPDNNFVITNAPCDGQGTTSMKYYRWNLRWKLGSESVVTYSNGTTEAGKVQMFTTMPKIQRITAKKNFASPMQSHKMGSVNSITDLYATMGMSNDANARISTYQEPFVGFQKVVGDDGTISYQFMGIYTMGADKGDKNTFGYDKKTYPNYLAIEGSDNAPLLTLFRVPYNPNKNYVAYNPSEEALQYNGANSWDYNSGATNSEDEAAMKTVFDSRWAEPYNFVYTCSTRIKPFNGTIDELNAAIQDYRTQPYEFWCSDYNLYYYEVAEGKYIPSDIGNGTINLKAQLCGQGFGLELSQLVGTLDEQNELFKAARLQRFKLGVADYFDVDDAIFFNLWVEINAGTDNRAKNTYPYIFGLTSDTNSDGKPYRWRWRHDDTDTIFDITNQGQALKPYYVEVYDTYSNGQPVWNGETNVFFDCLEKAFADRKKELAKKFFAAMADLSGKIGTDFEKLFAFYAKYYFANAQEYFCETLYNEDAKFCYDTASLAIKEDKYANDTNPMTQALGDHYSAERRWIAQRIIYMMSKYSYGMFSASNTDGVISVRAAGNSISYTLTPSVWLYPNIANGTSIIRGERTEAGQPTTMVIELGGSGDQQNNIMGANYLLDIGDWSDKNVSGTMTISGKMLRNIVLGNDDSSAIVISISSLVLGSVPMLESLKLSNISTLSGIVDLRNAGHIREVYADGTSITQIKLPSGSDLTTLSYGASNQYIVLNNQKQLTSVDYSQCKESVTTFAVSDCPNLDAFSMLVDIIDAQNQAGSLVLKGVRLQGINYTSDSSATLETLATLASSEGFFGVDADGNPITGTLPQLSGVVTINGYAYEDSVNALREAFPNLTINVTGYYIRFEDPEVLRVLLANGVGDGVGITEEAAKKVTKMPGWFRSNKNIRKFNEMRYFENVTYPSPISSTTTWYDFAESTIEEIDLRHWKSITYSAFLQCRSLKKVGSLENVTYLADRAFEGCTNLEIDLYMPKLAAISGYGCLRFSGIKKISSLGSITTIPRSSGDGSYGLFANCKNLTEVILPPTCKTLNGAFYGCTALTKINAENLTSITDYDFQGCTSLVSIDISSATSIGAQAFYKCTALQSIIMPNVKSIGTNGINACTSLESIDVTNVETFGQGALAGDNKLSNIGGALTKAITIGPSAFINTLISEYIIGGDCTSIGSSAFKSTLQTSFALEFLLRNGDTVTTIGQEATRGMTATRLVLREGLTSFGQYCFDKVNCPIVFPSTTTEIGRYMPSMQGGNKMYLKATTPPTIYAVFGMNVYIPKGSLSAYTEASVWSSMTSKLIEYDFEADTDNINQYCV